MMKKSYRLPFLGLVLLILAGAGCQSIETPKSTMKGQRSFKFMEPRNVTDKRFSQPSNERNQVIQQAIREVFEANGVQYAPEEAELVVGYLVIRVDNVSTTVIPTYYGSDYAKIQSLAHKRGVLKNRQADNFEVGAIVVDVIDARKKELIYRGSAKRDIMGLENMSELQPLVESAVKEALADFFE
jgi:hypothetical protein